MAEDIHSQIIVEDEIHVPKGFSEAANDTAPVKNSFGNLEYRSLSALGATGPTGPAGTTLEDVVTTDIENPDPNDFPVNPTSRSWVNVTQLNATNDYGSSYKYDPTTTEIANPPETVTANEGGLWIRQATSKPFLVVGTPTYKSERDLHTAIHSTGTLTTLSGVVTANGANADVAAGSGLIRSTNINTGELFSVDWDAVVALALTLDVQHYIYLEWNGGAPQVVAANSRRTDLHTNIYLGSALYDGDIVHIGTENRYYIGDHLAHVIERFQQTEPYERVSGGNLSEIGTRNIAITSGNFWQALVNFTTPAKDTSAADTFDYYYRDGIGGWTKVLASTQYNNLQYDDGSGALATLSNNLYGVHWVYVMTSGHVSVLYGRGDYSLPQAQDAGVPSDLPPQIQEHGFIIGRIIVQKSAATATEIDSVFETQFQTAQPTDHNSLVGLQGGVANERYHLTQAEHANVALKNSNQTFQNNIQVQGQGYSDTNTLADATTVATDCNTGNVQTVTLGGNRTLGNPTNLKDGATYVWIIKQDGVGTRTLAYGASFKFLNGSIPVLTTTINAVDILTGVSDGTNVYCSLGEDFK